MAVAVPESRSIARSQARTYPAAGVVSQLGRMPKTGGDAEAEEVEEERGERVSRLGLAAAVLGMVLSRFSAAARVAAAGQKTRRPLPGLSQHRLPWVLF